MTAYTAPSFEERAALAKKARQKALDQLRKKPPVDEAVTEARRAARLKRDAAAAEKSRAKRESEERAKADRQAALAEPAIVPAEPVVAPKPTKQDQTEADKKAARDARYAARKKRK
ncbi:hypothetical protein EAH79_13835 [Sphingomonas koreensis]|nr:hypothetical protein EAH79_13835 [Sphingomonas koreensis]